MIDFYKRNNGFLISYQCHLNAHDICMILVKVTNMTMYNQFQLYNFQFMSLYPVIKVLVSINMFEILVEYHLKVTHKTAPISMKCKSV